EELRATPLPQFRAMIEHVFGLDAGEALVGEALDYYSFQKQKEREWRFAKDEKQHFHFRGGVDYAELIGERTMARLRADLAAKLRHKFGYDYADANLSPSLAVNG
ncbi:MAG: hypothetical protein AB7G15_11440, partial [Alphaproteobacteria bacterium]